MTLRNTSTSLIGSIMAMIVVAGTAVAGQIEDCAAAMRTLQPQADKGNAEEA
jgi:hypothetical protein